MKQKKNSAPDFFEGLKLLAGCPMCKAPYSPMQARIIEERDDVKVVHVTCSKCANAVIALIMLSPMGISSVSLLTDCSHQDVDRVRQEEPISYDDVLDLRQDLKSGKFFDAIWTSNT